MTKTEDFHRINEPRIKRALDQIALVENSARSMKLPEEGAQLIQQVIDYVGGTRPPEEPEAAFEPSQAASEYVQMQKDQLSSRSTQQLIDIMIAAGAILQDRRK